MWLSLEFFFLPELDTHTQGNRCHDDACYILMFILLINLIVRKSIIWCGASCACIIQWLEKLFILLVKGNSFFIIHCYFFANYDSCMLHNGRTLRCVIVFRFHLICSVHRGDRGEMPNNKISIFGILSAQDRFSLFFFSPVPFAEWVGVKCCIV